jgi:hypothetical protein
MLSDEPDVVPKAEEVRLQASQVLDDRLRLLFHPHSLESQDDGHQIGVERGGGDRNHAARQGGLAKRFFAPESFIPDDRLVVDVLGGDVHEGELVRSLVREDVLRSDRVDVFLHVAHERFSKT